MQDEVSPVVPLNKSRPESETRVWYPGPVSRVRVRKANFADWQVLHCGRLAGHCVVGDIGSCFVDSRTQSEPPAVASMQDPLVCEATGHPVSGHVLGSPLSMSKGCS